MAIRTVVIGCIVILSSMNIVVTGANGFVGNHLIRELKNNGHEVVAIGQEESAQDELAPLLVEYAQADLAQTWPAIRTTVDAVIHLAGLAAVGPSFDDPQTYINLNSAMVTNMCEHYLRQDKKPRIVIVSSGAVYESKQPMPISEDGTIEFNSPYAVSKILTESQAAYYNGRGLDCVVVRPFNHIGPGQLPGFIVPDLAKKIQDRTSSDEPIAAGNLSSRRDYTDVRDVSQAYRLIATAANKPKELIYNVCSGESFSGEDVLRQTAAALGVPTPSVSVDQSLLRPNDTPDIRGDSTRLQEEFGWLPKYSFEQSINDFVQSLV